MLDYQAKEMVDRLDLWDVYWVRWFGPVEIRIAKLGEPYYGAYSTLRIPGVPQTQESGSLTRYELIDWLWHEGGVLLDWDMKVIDQGESA